MFIINFRISVMSVMPLSILLIQFLYWGFLKSSMERDGNALILKKFVSWPMEEFRAKVYWSIILIKPVLGAKMIERLDPWSWMWLPLILVSWKTIGKIFSLNLEKIWALLSRKDNLVMRNMMKTMIFQRRMKAQE